MKPTIVAVKQHYPAMTTREVLFADIGWHDLIDNPAYKDTCAIRMSYGLLRAGVALPGARMKAKAGPLKGSLIEPGQAKSSGILKRMWGTPDIYATEAEAADGIGERQGVVSFFRIGGGTGGHIDLIVRRPASTLQRCARVCFWTAGSIWFWPLK